MTHVIVAVLMLVSGVYLPVTVLPPLLLGLLSIPIGLQVFGLAERFAKRAGKLHRIG